MPAWATLVRAPNPGPMTLDGTNTWILRGRDALGCVIVDPGPDDAAHLTEVAAHAPVELIIVTHHHHDHTDGISGLSALLGGDVPVAAADPALCHGVEPLRDGTTMRFAGLTITAYATPGHTADSICLLVEGEAADDRAMVTGDTILGRGTAVVAWPDGDLGAYLTSLDRLTAYSGVPALVGHGPALPDCGAIAAAYRTHRDQRLHQVRDALAAGARTPADVVAHVYPDLDAALAPAAEWTVRAALAQLAPSTAEVADRPTTEGAPA